MRTRQVTTRFALLAFCFGAPVLAEGPIPASGLVGIVTAKLAVDRDDPRIARELRPIRLNERLSENAIELLRKMGAGPETVHQLRAIAKTSRTLPAPAQDPIGLTPSPDAAERKAMLDAARRYTSRYIERLPNFTCMREARRFTTSRATGTYSWGVGGSVAAMMIRKWYDDGAYTADAAYVGGADHYKLMLEDGKPTTKSFEELRWVASWGEFAGALREAFGSGEEFEWDRWEVRDGTRLAVFAYVVERDNSSYLVCCPPFRVAHRGFVYVVPNSGAIRRIIIYATGLGPRTWVSAAGLVVDYGEVKIGGEQYLLPAAAAAYSRTGHVEVREDIAYRDYHKFTADSFIAFPNQ
jgi:hypothetical protein